MRILDVAMIMNVIYIFCFVVTFIVSNNEGREVAFAVGAVGIGLITYLIETEIKDKQ